MDEKLKDSISGAALIALFVAASFLKGSFSVFGSFVALFAVLFHSFLLGKRLLPRAGGISGTMLGVVLFAAFTSIGQTIWFYLGRPLGNASDLWIMAVSMAACHLLTFAVKEPPEEPEIHEAWSMKRGAFGAILALITVSGFAYVALGAFHAATADSIRAPWPLLPIGTLAAVAVAWVGVLLTTWLVRSPALAAMQSSLAIAATTCIAPLVYKLGFGFDGFLHVAGEKQILATGTLNPKPLYYIGQYVFTTFLSRTASLPIEQVDRWLVPVAAAILIPLAMYLTSTKGDREGSPLRPTPYVLFLIPLSPFIATTPQSFAYLLGLAAVVLARGKDDVHPLAPILLAAWSIAVHPLAGVPFLFIAIALIAARERGAARSVFAWLSVLASAAAVPLLFYVLSANGGTQINWNLASIFTADPWRELLRSVTPWIGNRHVLWPAWSSLVLVALPILGMIGAIGTIVLEQRRPTPYALLLGSGVLLLLSSAVLKSAGDFAFLIDYERGNYAERLVMLATFLLILAALPSASWLLDRARSRPPFFSFALILACLTIAAAQSYDALPRHDALVTGRGWSVGARDIEAAREIDRDAGTRSYTVLANQSVSAAAVSQFGFKRYNGDVFYYPIPTGGPLYQTYLDLTYKEPSRDTVADAGKLGGTDLVYVVVNDYWWKADQLAESLSRIANQNWDFGEWNSQNPGRGVKVYKFDLKTPIKRSTQTSGS